MLAGTVLALIVAAPTSPSRRPTVEAAAPLPPSLNGRRRHRASRTAAAGSASRPSRQTAARADPGISIKARSTRFSPSSDAQITEKLRGSSPPSSSTSASTTPETARRSKVLCRAQLRAAVDQQRPPQCRAKAAIARLKDAAADGLDPADYPVPEFGTFTGAEALADGDIKLTNSVLTFARHLAVGRIAPTRVLTEVDYGDHTPEPADILRKIADAARRERDARKLQPAA